MFCLLSLAASWQFIVAKRSAALHMPNPRLVIESLIAATALVHGMTVVTRNVEDFQLSGVSLVNPWDAY